MQSTYVLEQLAFARMVIGRYLQEATEEEARIIPTGFNNSVLWQVGHILYTTELFLFSATGRTPALPDSYETLFSRGTRPSEWTQEAPTLERLLSDLNEQTERIRRQLTHALSEPVTTDMLLPVQHRPATISEMMLLCIYHEALHTGNLRSILSVVRAARTAVEG